jgi:hypothetical protein
MKLAPLPNEAIDIAVFSLSLMGINWQSYLVEAKRCLLLMVIFNCKYHQEFVNAWMTTGTNIS